MRGAVIHDPDRAPCVAVGPLSHDLGDEASERIDAGGLFAMAEEDGRSGHL
jgi:hypothetical protein